MKKRLTSISRRDFMNGVAVTIAGTAGSGLLAGCTPADSPRSVVPDAASYPPIRTGLRGNHPGSFEVAHHLAFSGDRVSRPATQTDEDYDLVVVGGGLSGLATAYYYRQRFGDDARILILDNHDDFGGHAKRNEFHVDGQVLLSHGGSQGIEAPSHYSPIAMQLLNELGVEPDRFYRYYDQSFIGEQGYNEGVYFDREHYGEDKLTRAPAPDFTASPSEDEIRAAIASFPMSEEARTALTNFHLNGTDYLAGLSLDEKRERLRSISYENFVREYAQMPDEGVLYLRRMMLGIWATGWDAMSAMEGVRLQMPGMGGLGFESGEGEPFIFIFPDGNASVARLLVRSLIPEAISGETMEDIVTAPADYSLLDVEGSSVRIRLSAMAIEARNRSEGDGVDVVYVKDGQAHRVRGRHAVMAGYNHMLPFLCPEMPEPQREALEYPEKTPLVYVAVALRNWRAFNNARVFRIYSPQSMFHTITLGYPVSMGEHRYPDSPDAPNIANLQFAPTVPGFTMKEQSRMGRQRLLEMPFEEFEDQVISQMTGALGPYGFDAERDIAAITVNRWPHGYAYEYNELEDDWSFGGETGPHVAGRAPIGRITIANSDSHASAYMDSAIRAAGRAVDELPEN
jgi:spermidine dehydrogenase